MNNALRSLLFLFCLSSALQAGEIGLTLQETFRRASQNSQAVLLAQTGTQSAAAKTSLDKSAWHPRLSLSSGLAKTWGFPLSIEGSGPSIFDLTFTQPLYDRQLQKQLSASRLQEKAGQQALRDAQLQAALQAGELYLELRTRRQQQPYYQSAWDSLKKVTEVVQTRTEAGVAQPRQLTETRLETARAALALASNREALLLLEEQLKQSLGLPAEAVLSLGNDEVPAAADSFSESELLRRDPLLQQLQLEDQSLAAQQQGLPRFGRPSVAMVGRYALFSKINNYDLYFSQFQPNNALLGLSIQVPLFTPETNSERQRLQAARNELHIKMQMRSSQLRIQASRLLANMATLQAKADVARLETQLARENLDAAQVQFDEGKILPSELEQRRSEESNRWISYLETQLEQDKSRLSLYTQSGALQAAIEPSQP
jgi:outer membrane protein TolC